LSNACHAQISGSEGNAQPASGACAIALPASAPARIGADGTPSYTIQTLDDWIARVKASGHVMLEEQQLRFNIERYGNIAQLWSSYALHSDGKQAARGINGIQAIKEAGGWRVTSIMVQAESATAPSPLPKK
jgi:hypothetical protein